MTSQQKSELNVVFGAMTIGKEGKHLDMAETCGILVLISF